MNKIKELHQLCIHILVHSCSHNGLEERHIVWNYFALFHICLSLLAILSLQTISNVKELTSRYSLCKFILPHNEHKIIMGRYVNLTGPCGFINYEIAWEWSMSLPPPLGSKMPVPLSWQKNMSVPFLWEIDRDYFLSHFTPPSFHSMYTETTCHHVLFQGQCSAQMPLIILC